MCVIKKIFVFSCLTVMIMAGVSGCAGTTTSVKPLESDHVYLDQWIKDAFISIREQLQTDSFVKGSPFIIVKAQGENVSSLIDNLTDDFRDRLTSHLLNHREIELVLRHPVPLIDRPYKFQDLKCGGFQEYNMLLTIDIKPLGSLRNPLARVNVRAMDLDNGTWARGFSVSGTVKLTQQQNVDLSASSYPDQNLQGLKYLPFTVAEQDEMAAYLARNLTCMFKEGYSSRELEVFVNSYKLRHHRNILELLKRQLNFCNEIQLVNKIENADWVLEAKDLETGSGTGLYQFWIEAYRRKGETLVQGLTTYAYYQSDGVIADSLSGRWEIIRISDRTRYGIIEINRDKKGNWYGNLFGKDGKTFHKRGVTIKLNGQHIDWTYYDDRVKKTFEVKGILLEDGEAMSVEASTFPSSTDPMQWELVLLN